MEKTIALIMMIGLGLLLQRKISSGEQLKGLKVLILSVALPATIFVALLNAELSSTLWILPVFALSANGIMLLATRYSRKLYPDLTKSQHRTLMMLIPSLAPGLSCFPFIVEYLGDESVAMAAVADVGNKLFVLILLYLLAMHWHHKRYQNEAGESRIKQLLIAMVSEPINLVILVALVMLGLGWNLESLPTAVGSVILRLSGIMAPLILLFIGLAVKTNKKEAGLIVQLLTIRSGIFLVFSALVISFLPGISTAMMLLLIAFPQSAASFWPYAHMSVINGMEKGPRTFDVNMALSVLAVSLPFSTMIILGIFSFQQVMVHPLYVGGLGALFILGALIPRLLVKFRSSSAMEKVLPVEDAKEPSVEESYVKAS